MHDVVTEDELIAETVLCEWDVRWANGREQPMQGIIA
jgi:hypothetical protein